MEDVAHIPISVGIPQQKAAHGFQLNNGHALENPSEDTELVPLHANHRQPSVVHNNNRNNYVSGTIRGTEALDIINLLEAMKKNKDHRVEVKIPAEYVPYLQRHPSSHFKQLSKNSMTDVTPPNSLPSGPLSPLSLRPGSDSSSQHSRQMDAISVKSYASVGMGSTDGKKMIVRKIPTSPVELFNLVNPPT